MYVPNNLLLGIWVIVITVQILGKYMIIGYLDPQGWGFGNINCSTGLGETCNQGHAGFVVSNYCGCRIAGDGLDVTPRKTLEVLRVFVAYF